MAHRSPSLPPTQRHINSTVKRQRLSSSITTSWRFNVSNALGATACAWALGVEPDAVARGLCSLRPSTNAGRANIWTIDGATFVADFAHNTHGVAALFDFLNRSRSGGRRIAIVGQAGDRSDETVREMARTVFRGGVDEVICRPLHKYLRGRQPMEIPELFAQSFRDLGLAAEHVHVAVDEADALRQARRIARAGDLVVALLAVDRDALRAFVAQHGGIPRDTLTP